MAFRQDDEALRARVTSLEDQLERAKEEAEQLRRERDDALAPARAPSPLPTEPASASPARPRTPIPRARSWLLAALIGSVLFWLMYTPAPVGSRVIWSASGVHAGEGVFAEWAGHWYAARVIAVHGTTVRVHYEGLPVSDDEDVGFWRVRAVSAARSP